MTNKQILKVIKMYRRKFERMGIRKLQYDFGAKLTTNDGGDAKKSVCVLEHCHSMLDQIEIFLKQKRREKVMRWLGFIQGVLWDSGFFTLNDLMKHNKPKRKKFKPD